MSIARGWIAACAFGLAALAGTANAAPVTYYFTDGNAHVTVSGGGNTLAEVDLTLDGISATFNEDLSGLSGPLGLSDFNFTTTPNQVILLTSAFGDYDQIVVNSASMTPGVGYSHLFASNNGGGNYSVTVSPVSTNGIYSASSSTGPPPPPVNNVAIMYDYTTPLNATVDVFNGQFEMLGVTLAEIPIYSDQGGVQVFVGTIVVKADLTFQGMTEVPEAGSLALIGLGLAGLASLRARRI